MSIQPVGYAAYPQTNVQQKKSNTGKHLLWTGFGAAVGAANGCLAADRFMRSTLADVKGLATDEKLLKSVTIDGLKEMGFSVEECEKAWNTNKKNYIDDAKRALDSVTKQAKAAKKAAAMKAAGLFAFIALVTSIVDSKTGKVKKDRKNPDVSHIVTTQSGQQLAVPVTLGSTTKIKPLIGGKYKVMTKATTPDAKWEVQKLTEQELLEKYSSWIK